jgi:hypothetical protein
VRAKGSSASFLGYSAVELDGALTVLIALKIMNQEGLAMGAFCLQASSAKLNLLLRGLY